jgi:c-di-GMP-related signal transduction protein
MEEGECQDIFCTGCDREMKKRNQFLESEVRDLKSRLALKEDMQRRMEQAHTDLHEMRKKVDRYEELLFLYRTAQTAKKALDTAELYIERERGYRRGRGDM